MRRAAAGLACCALACSSPPPPPADAGGGYVGAFAFTATLVPPGVDAGIAGLPETSCPIDLDAGFGPTPGSLTFYAYLSENADAGVVWWQILGGPVQQGSLRGGAFAVAVASCAPIVGCGCVSSVEEQVELAQVLPDGGIPATLIVPVLSLQGWIDDRLSSEAGACLDAGTQGVACADDAGPGCGIGGGACDLVYTVAGVPGLPGS